MCTHLRVLKDAEGGQGVRRNMERVEPRNRRKTLSPINISEDGY
jgi:hypothetical protein